MCQPLNGIVGTKHKTDQFFKFQSGMKEGSHERTMNHEKTEIDFKSKGKIGETSLR